MPRVAKVVDEASDETAFEVLDVPGYWVMVAPLAYRDLPEAREYFYEGEVVVYDGTAFVPRNRPEWAQRMLHIGYEWADGEQPEDFQYDY